jgi:hypothetical protein
MGRAGLASGIVAAALAAAGCDKPSSSPGVAPVPAAERRSLEHETCGRTADCDGELRCVAGSCRDPFDSPVGELSAARGDRAVNAGKPAEAIEHYAAALARYERDKIAAPARLLCAAGRATAAASEPDAVERAARWLHRCLLATPPGAPLHDVATAELAGLVERGLQPEALAHGKPVDVYVGGAEAEAEAAEVAEQGGAAAAPAAMTVKGDGASRSRSYRTVVERLGADPTLRAAIAPCLAKHEGPRPYALALELTHGFRLDENDDFDRATLQIAEPAAADVEARCVRDALAPLLSEIVRKLAEETRWSASITFEIAG